MAIAVVCGWSVNALAHDAGQPRDTREKPASTDTPQDAGRAASLVPPEVLTRIDAHYPQRSPPLDRSGDVVLSVVVGVDGRVSTPEIVVPVAPELDAAALEAARWWTFRAATLDGVAVPSRVRLVFHFEAPQPTPPQTPPTPPAAPPPVHPVSPNPSEVDAIDVTVLGRRTAPSRGASDFRVPRSTLTAAPHASAADLLATAPGVYVSHPEGDAIAQRVFLRGFDADHGQDVEFKVSGIPMNQSSHIHGQGYADLNLIIPEVVSSLRVVEGVYDPHQADFAVAGSVEYELGVAERGAQIRLGSGSFGTRRLVAIWAPPRAADETFGAATLRTTDGFGDGNRGAVSGGLLGQYRFALPANTVGLLHLGAYAARANVAGVLRRDDIEAGRVGFYDSYSDPSARAQSAGTSRSQIGLTVEHRGDEGDLTSAGVWLYQATFRSRLNFTGYTERSRVEPTWVGRGDLVEQSNEDLGIGGSFSFRSRPLAPLRWLGGQYEIGADLRTHRIDQAQNLLRAPQNEIWDQRDDATVRSTDVGLYGDLALRASRFVRVRGGGRADLLFFDVDDRLGNFTPAFSKRTHIPGFKRTASGIAAGPRATVEVSARPWLRLTGSYGEGYRSPQARQLEEGERAPFAKVRSYELGAVAVAGERATITAAAYQTNLSYDLAFDPGQGRLERIGPTTRRGFVAHVLATPVPWATASLSATFVRATLDAPPIPTPENPTPPFVSGQSLPYVPPLVLRGDAGVQRRAGSLRGAPVTFRVGAGATFLSARPLPYGETSPAVFLLDGSAGLRWGRVELGIDAINLLDTQYADSEFAFVSNWLTRPVPSRVPARHVAAGPPRTLLATLVLYL